MSKNILVTGGAGYVGAELVPKLLNEGHKVTVLDTFWYSDESLFKSSENLKLIKGDIRDKEIITSSLVDITDVIHLACISNDPSFDLDP